MTVSRRKTARLPSNWLFYLILQILNSHPVSYLYYYNYSSYKLCIDLSFIVLLIFNFCVSFFPLVLIVDKIQLNLKKSGTLGFAIK